MSAYFLTGGTGVVGGAIAGQLLEDPASRLTMLIRAPSNQALKGRLDELLGLLPGVSAARERVTAVRGDTSLPRFGLEPDEFLRLASACTHVIHCAAIVKMTLPLDEARRSAVEAARSVVALAREGRKSGKLEKVEFLSTVGVGGRWEGPLPERWITEPREFHNTYERAKAEAEDFLRAELERGFPITIHRPSMVVGDSRSGEIARFQVFYHLAEFLSGKRTFGVFPKLGDTRLDLVPVDYVARAVTWSSRQLATIGRVMHLCSGPDGAVPLGTLRDWVRRRFEAHGDRLPAPVTIPAWLLLGAVPVLGRLAPRRIRRAIETLPVFLDYLAENQSFANAETTTVLDAAGIRLPRADDYLDRVLDYYLAHRKDRHG
jgi:thioester reductase-like protein